MQGSESMQASCPKKLRNILNTCVGPGHLHNCPRLNVTLQVGYARVSWFHEPGLGGSPSLSDVVNCLTAPVLGNFLDPAARVVNSRHFLGFNWPSTSLMNLRFSDILSCFVTRWESQGSQPGLKILGSKPSAAETTDVYHWAPIPTSRVYTSVLGSLKVPGWNSLIQGSESLDPVPAVWHQARLIPQTSSSALLLFKHFSSLG